MGSEGEGGVGGGAGLTLSGRTRRCASLWHAAQCEVCAGETQVRYAWPRTVQHTREQANGQVAVLEPHVPLQGCLPLALDAWLGVPAVREKKGDASSAELDRRLVVLKLKLADQVDAQVVQLCTSLEVLSSGARAWGWIGPTQARALWGSREREG